jgi:hypothetical protein
MHIERQRSQLPHGADDFLAKRDIGYEAPVHHVEMDLIRTAFDTHRDLVGEMAEVGTQDGRSYSRFHGVLCGRCGTF